EPVHDLDGIHRRPTDLDRHAHRVAAVLDELEQADRGARLRVDRTSGEDDVLEPLDLDRPVDRKIRTRAARKLADELDVDLHAAAAHGRIDAHDEPFDDAVPRIDADALAELDVARLGLGNLQLGLQLVGPRDARAVRAERDALAFLDVDLGQHAGNAGADLQRLDLLEPPFVRVLDLIEP